MPAYHLLPMENYNSIIGFGKASTIIASRGCPFRCGFCYKTPSDKKSRKRNPKNIVKEIEYLIQNYKIEEIMFYDDTLTLDRNFVIKLCKEIKKSKFDIKWESPTRIDCVDKELLEIMKDAGCLRLRMGVESGNDKILKYMNKGITGENAKQVFEWCKEIGIETFAYFIIGYYGESKKTVQQTIKFSCELNPDYVMFTIGTPLPASPFWHDCVNDKLVDKDYWKKYTMGIKQDRIPYLIKDADKWTKKAYWKFYLRKKFIWNKIKKINSWDSLRKNIKGALAILEM